MKNTFAGLAVVLLAQGPELPAQHDPLSVVQLREVRQITADRAGDFYAVTSGAIHKYDSGGKEIGVVRTPSPVRLFDTGNGVRLLAYLDNSAYIIYRPSLSAGEAVAIDRAFAIEPWLACSSGDYNLIVLDGADWSVKTVDTRRSVVDSEFYLDSASTANPDFVFMREYQGFLFLLDRGKGISIFNRLGMKVKSLPVEGLRSFNFLGQELYYYKAGRIHFTDLFTLETRSVPFGGPCEDVVIGNGRCVALHAGRLTFYPFPASKSSGADR